MKTGVVIHPVFPRRFPADEAAAHLTDEEKQRAARFRFPEDAAHWAACRTALREILGRECDLAPRNVPLRYNEFGKPHLAGVFGNIHFNLSHCTNLALVAVSREGPVGIDLEPSPRGSELLGCEASFCHPLEIAGLSLEPGPRAEELLGIWVAKEALLKALGTGFSQPPEDVRILDDAHGLRGAVGSSPTTAKGFQIRALHSFPGYRAAVAAMGDFEIELVGTQGNIDR